jgi:hypothetical protein
MKARPIPDLARFRDQCTGIGQTRAASQSTGHRRSQKVIDCAPPAQAKLAVGYPPRSEYGDHCSSTEQQIAVQTTLYRGG